MRKPLRVGFVGCGRVTALRHLPALSRLDDAEVVALADTDAARLKHVAARFHVPNCYPDVRTLLNDATVDVIAVCVPVQFHATVALAALDAGKHVFIEKPLTVTMEEADQVDDLAKQVNRKVLMGFNFRWHRLIRQARELLGRGVVGQVETIRSVFASAHEAPSGWQMHRASGGGALFDQAIHVFDLWRFLLGSEVEEVFAVSRSGPWEDETVTVTARLTNGVLATATCSERTGENNEVEVYGRGGRLQVSGYRFDGLEYFPQGSIPGNGRARVEAALRTVKELPGSFVRLRHGGDVLASYREQWRHFLGAIRHDGPLDCTVEDGRRALQIVFAAMASASRRQPVIVAQAPSKVTPISVAPLTAASELKHEVQYARGGTMSRDIDPAMSIIIVADRYETIRQTIRHLSAQTLCDQLELVIVTQSRESLGLDLAEAQGFHSVCVHEVPEILPLAFATSAGIRRASAPIVVLAESHAYPGPGWAEALIRAHRQPWAAVGAVMGNANPGMISWANLFVDYGHCVETKAVGVSTYLPGHHTAYKRDILMRYDQQLDVVMDSEILLHWDLQDKGFKLYLDPEARVYHANISSLTFWLPERFYTGRRFAATRTQSWPLFKRFLYAGGSPLIPFIRVPRVVKALSQSTFPLMRWPLVLPPLVLGLVVSAVGEMIGYLFGGGQAIEELAKMELFKMQYLTKRDRDKLEALSLKVAREVHATGRPHTGEA